MAKRIRVIYENGVFRPLEPVDVVEHQQGTVTLVGLAKPGVDWLDTDYMASSAHEEGEGPTLDKVRQALAKIPGSLTEDFRAERDER
jgi:hypothetical protein